MGTQCPHRTLERRGDKWCPWVLHLRMDEACFFMTESYGKTENTFCCNAKEIKSTLLVQYLPDDQRKFLCTWITAGYQTLKENTYSTNNYFNQNIFISKRENCFTEISASSSKVLRGWKNKGAMTYFLHPTALPLHLPNQSVEHKKRND